MLFTIQNKAGAKAIFSSLGARLLALYIPNAEGELIDVIQGFDTEEEYATKGKSQGAICGRYANRIANARFMIEDQTYILPANDGEHCLHSGNHELRLADFKGEALGKQAHFTYLSPDLERGFPGNLKVEVTYTLTDDCNLKINFEAKTDKATPVNLTAHPYFNLNGAGIDSIFNHSVQINSSSIVEIDKEGIPTGQFLPVEFTSFDTKEEKNIGELIQKSHPQMELVGGFDHCFVVDDFEVGELKENATVFSPQSKIELKVLSTYPGIQLYTANKLAITGKEGKFYGDHSAICLEPQFFPDSPNQPNFPNTILQPKESYKHTIIYQFTVRENIISQS